MLDRSLPRLPSALALAAMLLVTACKDNSTGPGNPSDPRAAQLSIEPGALLLTEIGGTSRLVAAALDSTGAPVTPSVTWQSSNPSVVTISSDGTATAVSPGSASITAFAGALASQPILAVVGQAAPAVVPVADSLILGDPVPVDAAAEYGPGWQYRILVGGAAVVAVNDLVVGTGARPLAGRVVDAQPQGANTELTVELVPLAELFDDLAVDEVFPLVEIGGPAPAPGRAGPALADGEVEFSLAGFSCSASGEVPDLDLPQPTLNIDPDLGLAFQYENGVKTYAVVGGVQADFGYKPVLKLAFEGKVGCKRVLKTLTVPLNGFLSWFVGIQVPLGIGFELEGKLTVAEVGFDVSGEVGVAAELGIACSTTTGACEGVTTFEAQRDFDFEFISPDPDEQFKVELSGRGYVFANAAIGSAFSSSTQFEFIAASAGLKQSVDLATPTGQVTDTAYASGFKLEGLVDVGPGESLTKAIEKLGELLGTELTIDLTLVDIDETLAESPKGTFTISPDTVAPGNEGALGDLATFHVELDPITYLGIGSVDKVEFLWKRDDGMGGFELTPGRPACTSLAASPGQKIFECQTDFLDADVGTQTFHAFVHAKMFGVPLPLPLEIGNDANADVVVGTFDVCTVPGDLQIFVGDTAIYRRAGDKSSSSGSAAYGDVSSSASVSTIFGDDLNGVAQYAYFTDYLLVTSSDPSVNLVKVQAVVSGSAKASYSGNGSDGAQAQVQLLGGVWGATAVGLPSVSDSVAVPDTVSTIWQVGSWEKLEGTATSTVDARGEDGFAAANAALKIEQIILTVPNTGAPLPGAQVCSASGTVYPLS